MTAAALPGLCGCAAGAAPERMRASRGRISWAAATVAAVLCAPSHNAHAQPAASPPRVPAGRAASSERAALDRIYAHLAKREFTRAQAEWRPLALAVQQSIQEASGRKLPPAQEATLRLRVGEMVFIQGLLEARLGEKTQALELLRKADGYGFPPLDSPLMALAAECLLELNEPQLAAQAWSEIVKASPGNVAARLALGAALYAAGRFDAAATELEAVLRRDPARPQVHFYLGAVKLEQKQTREARAHLERELAGAPRCSACMAKLAHVAYLDGDDARCEGWLTRASALAPEDLEAHLVRGLLENRRGQHELATRHLLQVVEKLPAHATARYQLMLAYQRSGQPEKAREQREIYDRLLAEQNKRNQGVRGADQ